MEIAETRAGRPRTFDEDEVLGRALEVFWRHGSTNTTTRVLEAELGMKQSSIYNAFGSKRELLDRSLDLYLRQIEEQVVAPLDVPAAGIDELLRFVDDLVEWVSVSDRPGCMMLNLLAEQGHGDAALVDRARSYRNRLRQVIGAALVPADEALAPSRAELVLATVMGINIASRGGASTDEVASLAEALRTQIRSWA